MKATSNTKFKSVDDYLPALPPDTKKLLNTFRETVKAAPHAEEVISYNMPAMKLNGFLVYYAAYKNHIGFYPVSSAIQAFKKELSGYEVTKGTIRFSLDRPIPFGLISRIVKFIVKENQEKEKLKLKKA